jgi:hypothetical protein
MDDALRYAKLGWAIFPVVEGGKVPAISAKMGGKGVHDATTSASKIAVWWKTPRLARANIGLACGEPSRNLVVVDIDPRHGGDRSISALALNGRVFPQGPRVRTGNGGVHLYFHWEGQLGNSKGRLGDGIDTRANGGYVVAPPSRLRSSDSGPGGYYAWEVSPWDAQVPRLPIWLATMLQPKPARPYNPPQTFADASKAIDGLVNFASHAPQGQRNSSAFWAACRAAELAADGKIAREAAKQRMIIAGLQTGLPLDEVRRTVESAFNRPTDKK